MIRHIPHDSTTIPTEYRDTFLLNDAELQTELVRMTDSHTAALFGGDPETDLIFPVSRLLVDVERFENDEQEPMAARGMGVIYTQTHALKPLRRTLNSAEREELLNRYYRPHHARFHDLVEAQLAENGKALVVDCHSFPSTRLPYEIGELGSRPEICIGTDPFHTPEWISETLEGAFSLLGYSVAVNRPFSGAITPLAYYGTDSRVNSVMIEIRRDLYMEEETGERIERFVEVQQHTAELLNHLIRKQIVIGSQ